MTRQTLRIVVRRILRQFVVRVVASQAAYALIIVIVAATIEHAIRLKTNIVHRRLTGHEHSLFKTRVARSAERLRQLVPAQPAGIKNLRLIKFLLFHRDEMFLTWSMTGFTSDARS